MREWLTARDPLQGELDAARRRVARDSRAMVLAEHAGHVGALRERWAGLSLERRRAIIAAVLDRVVVGPGRRGYNRFDPSRCELVWRYEVRERQRGTTTPEAAQERPSKSRDYRFRRRASSRARKSR
jgi:hypothetical protein